MATTAGSGDAWRISGEDRAKHDSQFFSLKPVNGFITGEQARGFFMQSGLPTPVLGQIWGLADMNNDGKMDKKEFSIAMHLIKKKLQGYELPKALPPQLKADPAPVMGSFGGGPVPGAQPAGMGMGMAPNMGLPAAGMGMGMGPRMPMMANGLPHMVSAPGYMGGAAMPVQAGGFAGGVPVRTGTPPVGGGNMAIPHQSKLKYTQMFNTHDRNKRGSLTGVEARSILVQTGVPQQMLAQIWNLSDIDKDGRLDCEEFCIALHLTDMVKMGQVLPAKLPPELMAGKARSGSFGTPAPMAAPAPVPQQDGFGDLLGSMGMPPPVQPVANGETKQEEAQDLSPVTFEDKRKLNFDKGQAELERRRQQLQEQMRKENEARLEKERKEQEKRDKHRQEQEMKRQQELEKQLEKQRAIERDKEEQRRKMMEQREAARRELERQRQMEWERQRKEQLMAEKAREYEQLSALKSQSSNLKGELELLQGKKSEINGKISQVKNGVTDFTAHIEAMRSTRDLKNNDIDRLQKELQVLNQKLHTVQSDRESLDLRVQTSIQSNPMSETHRTMMHSVELKKTSVQKLKKDLEQTEKDTETRLAEIDNLNTQFKEFNASLASLQADISSVQKQNQDKAKQSAEEQARLKNDKDKHEKLRKELEAQRKKEETATKSTPEPPKAAESSSGNWFAAFGGDTQTPAATSSDNWASVFDAKPGGGAAQSTAIDWGSNFSSQAKPATSESKTFKLSGQKKKYTALYQFDSRNEDELSLRVGDIVMVFDDQTGAEPGWKGGEMGGVCGWFPEAYVEKAAEESSPVPAGPSVDTSSSLLSSGDSSFMTVPVKVPAVSPTPGQGQLAPDGLQAQALYPWKAKKENHLTFNKGDVISVQEQQDMWWSGELNGQVGWFPKSYVKLISGPSAITSAATSSRTDSPLTTAPGPIQPTTNGTQSPATALAAGESYIAVYTYQSNEPGDLTFNQGETVSVTKKDGDWWTGISGGRTGIFPANYVKKHDLPQTQQPPADVFGAPAEPSSADLDIQAVTPPAPEPTTSITPDPSDTKTKVTTPVPQHLSTGVDKTMTNDASSDDVFRSSDVFSESSFELGLGSPDSGAINKSPFLSDPFAEFGKIGDTEMSKEKDPMNDLNELDSIKKPGAVGSAVDGTLEGAEAFPEAKIDEGFKSNDLGPGVKPGDPFANLDGITIATPAESEINADPVAKLGDQGQPPNDPFSNIDTVSNPQLLKSESKDDPFVDFGGLGNANTDKVASPSDPLNDIAKTTNSERNSDPFSDLGKAGNADHENVAFSNDPFTNTNKATSSEPFKEESKTDPFAEFGGIVNSGPDQTKNEFSENAGDAKDAVKEKEEVKPDPFLQVMSDPFSSFPETSFSAADSKPGSSDPFAAFGDEFSSAASLSSDPFAGSEELFGSDPFSGSHDNAFHSSVSVDLAPGSPTANPFGDSPANMVQSIEDDAGTSLPQNLDLIQSQNPSSCDSSIQTSDSLFNLSAHEFESRKSAVPKRPRRRTDSTKELEPSVTALSPQGALQDSLTSQGPNTQGATETPNTEHGKQSPGPSEAGPKRPRRRSDSTKASDIPNTEHGKLSPGPSEAEPTRPRRRSDTGTKPAGPAPGPGATGTLKKPEIATVIASYTATGEEQLSLNPGQLIQVRKKSPSGWWEGELQARGQKRKIGWFPANYVKLLQASARNTPDNMLGSSGKSSPAQAASGQRSAGPSPAPQSATSPPVSSYVDHVIAIYPYTAQNPDELTFQKDAVINVVKKDNPDWWQGELNGQTGMFPSNYVQSSSPEASSWSTDPQVLALTSKEEGRRQSHIKELIDTEETYMADMSIVLDAFYKPLRESGAMTEEQLNQIFVNWKELIVCNTKLQKALRVRKKMCGIGQVINSIGDILCENIPHLTPYIRFCSCQLNAAALLQKISESNPKFQEIHKRCVQNPKTKGMPLSSFLLKPMQRITKYPLIVDKILKYTPESHPDHTHLIEALEHCQELCSQVNEGVREKENSDRLEWIQQHVHCDGLPEKITFNSVTNCLGPRKLLHNGVVYKTKSNKELGAFLFNDFLLLTTSNKPLNNTTHSLFDTTGSVQYKMYKSERQYPMQNVKKSEIRCSSVHYSCNAVCQAIVSLAVQDVFPIVLNEVMIKKPGSDDSESFVVSHIDRMYNLRCHNQNERDTWVKRLDTASRQYLDTERKKREKAISSPKISRGVGRLLVIILEGSNLICSKDVRRTPGVGRLLVVIIEGKDLQASDDNGKSDPYCEVSMGAQEHKTKVIANTLSPRWNASMQFVIRDLQMDSLCITVFDRDLFSPNDFLGRTEIRVADILKEASQQEGRGPILKRLLLHEVPTGEVLVKLDLHLYDQT